MHISKDDYLINTLRFVSRKEASQIYGAVLPECLTSPEMKESKAYKTYLGHATDEEHVQKGKGVKRSAKKSSTTPATGIVFRETLVETKSIRKEKLDVSRGKGIDLLSEVALAEKAQLKEVRKKCLRDFHKTHPSGLGTVAEKPPSVEKITPTVIGEGTSDKPGVPDVIEDDSTESEFESWGNDEDDSNNKQESSNEGSAQENESEEQESDSEQDVESDDDNQEEEEVDQENEFEDDEIEKPTQTGKEVVQGEGADVEMNEAQQGNENLETTQEQVVDDAHVTITTTRKTKVHVTSSSRSSDLASKFLNFLDIPHTNAEIVSPLDVHPQILPKEVSNFALHVIEKLIKESRDEVTIAKVSSQPQSTYEAASTLTEFELKKILLDKMDKSKSCLTAPEHRDCYDGLKKSYALDKYFFYSYDVYSLKRGRKDKDKDEDPSVGSDRGLKKRKLSKDAEPTTEEPVFEVADSNMPQDQEGNLGDNEDEPRNETASKRDWFKKPTPPQEPTDPDWNIVAYDRYALWGISHWRQQRKSFYAYARGMQSRGDVYSTKRILAVTHVKVMRKHGYGYLEEIVVRRADNALYRFKEGDFPRLRINDIEDMLLLVVQNRLTNLSGDDVADFAIALRMFTRSLVIQKRVEDLQLGVESYQKKINVTKLHTKDRSQI
ncbi:hypothetical protein Tco_1429668 [Tanacetum coccineum]